MTLSTAFTRLLGVAHPIVSAPMGGSAGGALAGAVSAAGGLGLVGGGFGDREWLDRELPAAAASGRPWGIGFLTWGVDPAVVARTLDRGPAAVMFSFGDPAPFADPVRSSGARLILQVSDLDEARRAVDLGADVIVAQGSDAGGHNGARAIGTLSFVPEIVDLVAPIPVLAAGGIVDGRGLAAALALGAAGALLGTRFQASLEAIVPASTSTALLDANGADTERNRLLDIARGSRWPAAFPARTLPAPILDEWRGREAELIASAERDPSLVPIWAGQAVGRITTLEPAADLVTRIAAEASSVLTGLAGG